MTCLYNKRQQNYIVTFAETVMQSNKQKVIFLGDNANKGNKSFYKENIEA